MNFLFFSTKNSFFCFKKLLFFFIKINSIRRIPNHHIKTQQNPFIIEHLRKLKSPLKGVFINLVGLDLFNLFSRASISTWSFLTFFPFCFIFRGIIKKLGLVGEVEEVATEFIYFITFESLRPISLRKSDLMVSIRASISLFLLCPVRCGRYLQQCGSCLWSTCFFESLAQVGINGKSTHQ